MSTDITDDAANSPRRVSGDQGSVEQHNLSDLIEYEQWKADKDAAKQTNRNAFSGIKLTKTRHPGTV